jgi:CxxC motif-containing protein (DUF1111 family)
VATVICGWLEQEILEGEMRGKIFKSRIAGGVSLGVAVVSTAVVGLLAAPGAAVGQMAAAAMVAVDPGPRGGPAGAGGPIAGLTALQLSFFNSAQVRFQEIDSVSGTVSGQTGVGLGPRFNGDSCAMCHAFPAIGGSSPTPNPQLRVAVRAGANNTVPSFITSNGPVREARFINNPDGTPDGGVHDLFTITGRSDASGCNISQPDFVTAIAQANIIFRIPTPLFGLGVIENIPDDELRSQEGNVAAPQQTLGISPGVFNISGNDGTITKFGWKAQNKSLLIFSGEAYNVEQGVTNEAFTNERDTTSGCVFNPTPEDNTNLSQGTSSGSPASDFSSDIVNFAAFARLSAPPVQATAADTTGGNGSTQFHNVGCGSCHIPRQRDANSPFGGMSRLIISPYTDLALHTMGTGLQDGISQGVANGQQFRTAPLWGVGQRLFFLHDGRATNLIDAINAHQSSGSEANTVVNNFNLLSPQNQQDLLVFLRSL